MLLLSTDRGRFGMRLDYSYSLRENALKHKTRKKIKWNPIQSVSDMKEVMAKPNVVPKSPVPLSANRRKFLVVTNISKPVA